MLLNTSFRITILYCYIFRQTQKMRLLKSCSYDCSALKSYTTVQFSGDDLPKSFHFKSIDLFSSAFFSWSNSQQRYIATGQAIVPSIV